MLNDIKSIWRDVLGVMQKNAGQIFLIHLTYTALGVILFTPLVGIVGQFLLQLSGQPALADQDIVYFLLTPSGIIASILFAGLLITILAFEQASLMMMSAGALQGQHVGTIQALKFTARRTPRIFAFTIQLVSRMLIITLPFLAAAGAIAWFLITDHDINYYLTEKPPSFLIAAVLIGLLLLAMLILLVGKLLAWSLALPLLLFTEVSPAKSFAASYNLSHQHKRMTLTALSIWALAALLLGMLVLACVQFLGWLLIPAFQESINPLVILLGGLVALWSLGHFVVTTFTSGGFAFLLVTLFHRYEPGTRMNNFTISQRTQRWRITTPRFVVLMVAGTLVAALTGAWLLHGIQVQDDVLIVAHRGAAGKAPENTLASIRQAIKDHADWVEIDVQETLDGAVVVIHDSDFMKLAGVDLKVWDGTLEQIREIDVGSWFSPEFSAERVPTLAEVLQAARGQVRVVIELKYYGHDQQLEQRVIDIVEAAGMTDQVAIMSLKYEAISKIRALRPRWIIGLLSAKAIGNLSKLDMDFLAVHMGMVTPGFIHGARKAGKHVLVWTVNDPVSIFRMISLGVDGVITDEPGMAREVIVERSGLSSVQRLLLHTAILFGQPIPQLNYGGQSS